MTDLADRRDIETTVYQPAEDSQLLVEAAQKRLNADDRVLDVGTGSGYVAAAIRDTVGAAVIGTDINPHACRAAAERGIETICADLVAPFADRSFDAVVMNPPYLPAVPALPDDWMHTAITGGESGRAVINRALATIPRVLRPDGRLLLVVSSLADVQAVSSYGHKQGLTETVVCEESFPFERLLVQEWQVRK